LQHLLPSCRIEKGNSDGMLQETGNACCRSGRDQCANFVDLMVLKRDGDFSGRHTKNHTTQIGPSRYELRLYHPG
jgi:hypothetical protein